MMLNQLIIKLLPLVPKNIVHIFAKKYIAGSKLVDAVNLAKDLELEGGMSTIDALGEFVTTRERANFEKSMSLSVLDAIDKYALKSYLSIKPTSLGMGIDTDFGYENIKEVVEKAKSKSIFVRLDMENSPFTSNTLEIYKKLRHAGYDNVGIVIQAYMRRSEDDIRSLIELKPSIRLCKGIYVENASIAYKGKEEIRDNYKKLLKLILDNGLYVGIATHDEPLIKFAESEIKSRGLSRESYEFQMLLGVSEDKRDELIRKGYRIRIYLPFGEDWYGYSVRRLKENPQMAGHVFKSIIGIK